MMSRTNEFGQPIGEAVPDWKPCSLPQPVTLTGRTCRLEPLNTVKHADDLFAAYNKSDGRDWTYKIAGPFATAEEFRKYAETEEQSLDPRHYSVIDLSSGKAVGTMALEGSNPTNGVVEVGKIAFSPLLKQSTLSTEAQYLLMAYAFDELGYRRYEWRCDYLNEPSRKAATRLGFMFEGNFENYMIYKGWSHDTAWYSITVNRWPNIEAAFQAWLAPENFDGQGRQVRKLEEFREEIERNTNGTFA